MRHYKRISAWVEAKTSGGRLYVRYTNTCAGMLEQGGRFARVICEQYSGTIEEAQEPIDDYGTTEIRRLIAMDRDGQAQVVRHGRIIN